MVNSRSFYDKSIASVLSAIEIYNKPNFNQRSEVFTILLVNAFESLLKAKILFDNNENIESIYISNNNGGFKTNRNGTHLSLEIIGCTRILNLDSIIIKNLKSLIEIRDASIHFVNEDRVDYLVFTLGSAALRNYYMLCKEWFNFNIDKYNFYILPLGFIYNFKTFQLLDIDKEPGFIKKLLERISTSQTESKNSNFEFICEVEVNLKSAKKVTNKTDLEISINNENSSAAAIIKERSVVEKYPLTATQLFEKVKEKVPSVNRNEFFSYIKDKGIKSNPDYSCYNFRNLKQKQNYQQNRIVPNGIPSIYNHDCLKLLISVFSKIN